MLDGPAFGVHLVDVDAGNPTVLGIVVEQIDEVDMCPNVVAGCRNTMDYHPEVGAIFGDFIKKCG